MGESVMAWSRATVGEYREHFLGKTLLQRILALLWLAACTTATVAATLRFAELVGEVAQIFGRLVG